jgi:hypothetical protein
MAGLGPKASPSSSCPRSSGKRQTDGSRRSGEATSRSPISAGVVAHEEDFSQHNPIHRWWGGTELTNDRLWRLKPVLMKP